MILRKMSDAFRARDWLGIVLEILIVMIGIFLGLQVDDWNQNRQARALEHEYLERMWIDANTNARILDRYIEFSGSNIDGVRDALDYVLSDGSDAAQLARIKKNGVSVGKMASIVLQSSAYQELISSGRLGLIRNIELREALQKVQVGYHFYEGQSDYFRQVNLSILPYEFENFDNEDFVRDQEGQIGVESRIERFLGNKKYARTLLIHLNLQQILRRNMQGIGEDNQQVLAILACELHKPECTTIRAEKEPSPTP